MKKVAVSVLFVFLAIMAAPVFGEGTQKSCTQAMPATVVQEPNSVIAEPECATEEELLIAMGTSPECSGSYGCSGGVRYKCTFDHNDKKCKWQPTTDTCASGDPIVTSGGECQ